MFFEGSYVGETVGWKVGARDGLEEGSCVGLEEGSCVGLKDGSCVGSTVGFKDGPHVGISEGSAVGMIWFPGTDKLLLSNVEYSQHIKYETYNQKSWNLDETINISIT